jgi:HSP20 family protein
MTGFYDDLLRQLEQQDDRRAGDLFWRLVRFTAPGKFWEPPVDVYETRHSLKIKAEIAGVRREELQVELAGDGRSVTIRGLRQDGDPDLCDRIHYHQMEIYTGAFERTVPLPAGISFDPDEVEATYQDGFLVVSLPKRPAKRRTRTQIRVQG